MSGQQRGCAAQFQVLSPRALYSHCSSHDLNLALSKASSLSEIHSMLSAIQSLGIFLKCFPNNAAYLRTSLQTWTKRVITGLNLKVQTPVWNTLGRETYLLGGVWHHAWSTADLLEGNCHQVCGTPWRVGLKTVTDANWILSHITKCSFIAAFQCALFFRFTKSMSMLLQGSTMDVMAAFKKIQLVKDEYADIRKNAVRVYQALPKDGRKDSSQESMGYVSLGDVGSKLFATMCKVKPPRSSG